MQYGLKTHISKKSPLRLCFHSFISNGPLRICNKRLHRIIPISSLILSPNFNAVPEASNQRENKLLWPLYSRSKVSYLGHRQWLSHQISRFLNLIDTRQEKKFATRQSWPFWPVPSTDRCADSRRAKITNFQIQDSRYIIFKTCIRKNFFQFPKFRTTRFLFLARENRRAKIRLAKMASSVLYRLISHIKLTLKILYYLRLNQ